MNNKKISFDWDNTIAMSYMIDSNDGSSLPEYNFQGYNWKIIELLKDYHSKGADVYIVTARKKSLEEYYPTEAIPFHLKKLGLTEIIPLSKVHYTDGDLKAETLKRLDIQTHYDDSMEEIISCKTAGIDVRSSMDVHRDSSIVAKGIVLDIHNSILLLRRTDNGKKWDIPGGHIKEIEFDRGLKGLADGFEREVAEETGLIIPHSKLIHQFDNLWKEKESVIKVLMTEYAIEEPPVDLFIQDFQENGEYKWVSPDEMYLYTDNMTQVAHTAIYYYLDNMEEAAITEAKYLPSQSKSWAKMKNTLIGLGNNKETGGGKGHTRPKMTKSDAAPPDFGVLEDRDRKKKELKSKLSKILTTAARKSSSPDAERRVSKIMDALSNLDQSFENPITDKTILEDKSIYYAETLAKFIQDPKGNPFEQVTIKGKGYGYYYSMSDKKTILVPRAGEYYLISDKADHKGRLRVYSHYKFTQGVVLLVPEDEVKRIGWN